MISIQIGRGKGNRQNIWWHGSQYIRGKKLLMWIVILGYYVLLYNDFKHLKLYSFKIIDTF